MPHHCHVMSVDIFCRIPANPAELGRTVGARSVEQVDSYWHGCHAVPRPFNHLPSHKGDIVYLVPVTGSNLHKPLKEGSINLTHAGLQRHRVPWIGEMSKEEIRHVGENGPTIDSIQVAEIESHDALRDGSAPTPRHFCGEPKRWSRNIVTERGRRRRSGRSKRADRPSTVF